MAAKDYSKMAKPRTLYIKEGRVRMKLTQAFKNKEFVITSEVGPVKGCARNGRKAPFIAEAEHQRIRPRGQCHR